MSTTGTAAVNGQRLYYEVSGSGTPLVLIMGIGYDATLWGNQVPAFSEHFSCVTFDNRDVGRSSKASGPYSIDDMADDVVGLLDHLHLPKAHVLGLSMGAMIGQSLAVRHPDRVDRLVLTGAAAAPARAAFDPIQVWGWLKARDAEGGTFAAEQFVWLFSTSFLRNRPAVDATVASLQSNPNPVTPEAYARQASAYVKFDILGRLGSVKAKTLVITGEQDLLTPPWLGREIAAAIPNARFELVSGDGASHVLPLERPGDFNRLVVDFLKR